MGQANPVYDDEAGERPRLHAVNGGGEGDGTPAGNLHAVPPGSTGAPIAAPYLRSLEGGAQGDGTPSGNLHSVSNSPADEQGTTDTQEASSQNLSAAEATGGLMSAGALVGAAALGGENPAKFLTRAGRFFLAGQNRRRTAIGGGLIGLAVGGGFLGLSFMSGPFQFIHIAQLLSSHGTIASQNDASDERMGKLYRFLRNGGDPGETRLGHLSSSLKTKMLADLDSIGLKPDFSTGTVYKGFTIDTTNEKSPYYGMDEQQVKDHLAAKGISPDNVKMSGANITVSADGYTAKKTSLRAMVSDMHESKIPNALRVRILAKYGFVTWHPLKILDGKLNSKVYELWDQAREKRLSTGQTETTIDTTNAERQDTTETDGKSTTTTTPVEDGKVTIPSAEDIQAKIKSIHADGLGGVGAAADGVGLLCATKAASDSIGILKYSQDIMPLMRMSFDAITVGHQIMAGKDVDTNELSKLSKQFFDESKRGTSAASWANAQTFQADAGEAVTGADINPGLKDTLKSGKPGWLSWVDHVKGTGPLCSKAGGWATTGIGIVVGIFSGGTVSAVVGTAIGYFAAPRVMDKLSHLLAGDAVNVLAQGAEWGNDVNYGAIYNGNAMAVQSGATQLSPQTVVQLSAQNDANYQAGFSSKNLADRLLDPYDSRSLLSHVIDQQNPDVTQNVASLFGSFSRFGSTLFRLPGMMFSGITHATPSTSYTYEDIPQYGFSPQEMDKIDDPYANAQQAAATLNVSCTQQINGKTVEVHPCGQDYVNKARTCFNVTITGGPSNWDVIPGASNDASFFNFYDPTNYNPGDCAQPSGLDATSWLQIRFFIFDTGVMEGYACQQGDETSCSNDGMNSAPQGASSTANSSIETSQLYQDSSQVACAAGTKPLGVQQGYTNGQEVDIELCAIPNFPSTGEESNGGYGITGADGNVVVNSRVSGAVLAMINAAAQDGVKLTAISSFRTMSHQEALCPCDGVHVAQPGYSNHQMGLAIDFGGGLPSTPGPVPGNQFWDWLSKNAGSFGYKNYDMEAWHWSPTGN